MTKVKTRLVTLESSQPIEIEPRLFLPPGEYGAEEKQLGVALMGGIQWTKPEYRIELTAEQLRQMGLPQTSNLLSVEFDVGKFVHSGEFVIR
jgi:hypothetical protein